MRQAALSLLFLAISSSAFAADTIESVETIEYSRHEILLSATRGNFAYNWPAVVGPGFDGGLSAGYDYTLFENFQIGIFPSIGYSDTAGLHAMTATVLAGPTLSLPFGMGFQNAFFVSLAAGFQYQSITEINYDSTDFVLSVLVGKRFQLFSNLVYRPTVGLVHSTGGNQLVVNPLALSVVF